MSTLPEQNRLDEARLRWIYRHMVLIRDFEERVYRDFMTGRVLGAIHLYAGEESVAVGVCAHLLNEDYVTSTHRGHGHCIAKGMDPKLMMAELYGKSTGVCRAKGGSMHLADLQIGMLGANGIVPAGLPLACGAALSAKARKANQVAVAFFGDGASNAGGFHESLNLAAVLKLPVVFVLENNGYADATHIRYAAAIENLSERAAGYGLSGVSVDGTDLFAVYEAAGNAVEGARKNQTPSLLECKTYRYYGHFLGDSELYRTKEEVTEQKQRDCIKRFEQRVLEEKWLSKTTLEEIRTESVQAVKEAVSFAENSPLPRPEECLDDVYVRYA